MKKYCFFALIISSILFISCEGDVNVSIFSRDLSDVTTGREEILYTNANIVVENLKDEEDIIFLRNNLNGFSNERFVKRNYSDSFSFDIKVPVTRDSSDYVLNTSLLILEGKKNDNGYTDYYLSYNYAVLEKLDRYFYARHYQNIDLSKFKIKLEVNNDERKPIILVTYSSYVNGKPYPFMHEEILYERDRLTVDLSEIYIKYISNENPIDYPVFSIKSGS